MTQSAHANDAASPEAPIREAPPEPSFRILKTATCPTLSGKSRLSYQVGLADGAETVNESTLHFRIVANSGGGIFNPDWVSLHAIHTLLKIWGVDKSITSTVLYPMFLGKSSNSPAFLLAVLKSEGVIQLITLKPRIYKKGDSATCLEEMTALHAAGVDLSDAPAEVNSVKSKPDKSQPDRSKSAKPQKKPSGKTTSKAPAKTSTPA